MRLSRDAAPLLDDHEKLAIVAGSSTPAGIRRARTRLRLLDANLWTPL
jgi:hypothetical protein